MKWFNIRQQVPILGLVLYEVLFQVQEWTKDTKGPELPNGAARTSNSGGTRPSPDRYK